MRERTRSTTPVFPYRLRRSKRANCAELLLQLPDRKSCLTISLNMEQARALAAELHGLSIDRCSHHDIVISIAASFGAAITKVALRDVGDWMVAGAMRLETESRVVEVDTEVSVASSIGVHRGIPLFISGKSFGNNGNLSASLNDTEAPEPTEIPRAFREVIQGLDMPAAEAGEGGWD